MANENETKKYIAQIPQNFATDNSFLGYELKFLNVIQAIGFGSIPFFITYGVITKYIKFDNKLSVLSITAMFAACLAYIGFAGVDNVTPLEYLIWLIKFKKRERKTYFNPRVKKEMISLLVEQNEANQTLPREKVMKMYNDFLEKRNIADQQKAHSFEENEIEEGVYFEEDFAVMDKPVEYMTNKEIKQFKKEQKQAQRKRVKETKKQERELKKNAKEKHKQSRKQQKQTREAKAKKNS